MEWNKYVQKWGSQLKAQRAKGMMVTTPFFTGGSTAQEFNEFFQGCSVCDDKNGPGYIDVIVWNAWLGDWSSDKKGQANWIKGESKKFSQAHGGRPVWLGNFAYLGSKTADKQIETIETSDIMGGGAIQRVYWFVATDFGGGTKKNFLQDSAGGKTIGQALIAHCKALG